MSTVNWSELIKDAGEITSYDPIPEGDYDFVVAEVTPKTSASNKPMFVLKAQVEGGAHAKRLVWDNLVVTHDNPSALRIFFSKMMAMGLTTEFFDSGPNDSQIAQVLVGRRFRAQVGIRTYNGSQKNEIKRYYPARSSSVPGVPVSESTASAAPAPAPSPSPAPAPAPAPAPSSAPAAPF